MKHGKPNKLEAAFWTLIGNDKIDYVSFNLWKFFEKNGRRTRITPDFQVRGTNAVIEVFGDFWHEGEDPQNRINDWARFNMACMVVWESEIKRNPEDVRKRVYEFIETQKLTNSIGDKSLTECNTSKAGFVVYKNYLEWKDAVIERYSGFCVNCDSGNNIAVSFIVPPECGGRLVASNGVTVCRDCWAAADKARLLPNKIENKTAINFFVSRNLYNTVSAMLDKQTTHNISSLIRSRIKLFIDNPEVYYDIANFQDEGHDVKINGWVDGDQYERFKLICSEMNLSYSHVFKALLMIEVNTYKESRQGTHGSANRS